MCPTVLLTPIHVDGKSFVEAGSIWAVKPPIQDGGNYSPAVLFSFLKNIRRDQGMVAPETFVTY